MEQSISPDGTLVFTITSNGYKEYSYNLWLQLYRLQVQWQLLIVCLDRASYDYFTTKTGFGGFKPVAMLLVDSKAGPSGATQQRPAPFGSTQFKKFVEMKLDALRLFAANGAVRHLAYMDSDIMVRRDPVPRLRELLVESPLWFQCDEGHMDACRDPCRDQCTGLIAMDCDAIRAELCELFKVASKDGLIATSDQDYVQRRLDILGITFRMLPRTEFPNGVWRNALPSDALLLHFNHCLGSEKQKLMRDLNAWII